MEYKLSVIVSLSLFVILDLFILSSALRNDRNSITQKIFIRFAFVVTLQQLFALMTQISDPAFNLIGNVFSYFAYSGSLIFMTASSFYCYRYLRTTLSGYESSTFYIFLQFLPVSIITIGCLLAPVTHWVFYIDEAGVYQRGKLFFLQMACPYIYIFMSSSLAIGKRKKEDLPNIRKMLRFFIVFMIPSIVGVCIQMFIVKGAYSAIGVSIGLMLMYLEIYIEDINENKRLKSIESLNTRLQQINEEQNLRINQIDALNKQLQENQTKLERSAAEQSIQLKEISQLNSKLEDQMNLVQTMSKIYFVSFYADLRNDRFIEISNTDFVRKYVGSDGTASQALKIFCNLMVDQKFTEELLKFVDLSTLSERMKNKIFITCDYYGNVAGWCQLYFIAGDKDKDGNLESVFLAARTIHDEKERELAQNRELDNARIAAEASSAAKTVFLNNMSHDIRTPLNAILGFSDLMAKEKDKPEVVDNYLKKIKTSGEYLLSIINSVLDMARIESGKIAIERNFMNIIDEEEKLRSYIGDFVESSNHQFLMKCNISHPYVMADAAKFQQILMNLVSNAVKYTPKNGYVHLYFDELPSSKDGYGRYRMIVEDNGIGMTKEFLEHIFDSFARERNTTDSKVVGTGLGMSIVKRLVDFLGAEIVVESEKDKGSKFIITADLELVEDPSAYLSETKLTAAQYDHLKGKRILVAEDNDLNAEIAEAILEDYGFLVERAENGLVCLEMLEKAPKDYYDLILMDIQMPELNGYETAERIRNSGNDIPIVAMTANAFAEDKRKAIESGMNDHLSKPIDISTVLETLARILDKQ